MERRERHAVGTPSYIGTATAGWSFLDTGDFNGDGTADILVTNDGGALVAWSVENPPLVSWGTEQLGLPSPCDGLPLAGKRSKADARDAAERWDGWEICLAREPVGTRIPDAERKARLYRTSGSEWEPSRGYGSERCSPWLASLRPG